MNSLTHLAESCHKVSKPQPCYHGHYIELCSFVSLFLARQSSVGHGLLIHEVSTSHTTHHTQQDSSVRVISSSQRLLPDNTQQSQQTDIHALGGIRTHNLSRRAAVDLRLRPRGYWDRHLISYVTLFSYLRQNLDSPVLCPMSRSLYAKYCPLWFTFIL